MSSINPLPTIPTDNYHKFRAIAGLWLVITFFVFGFGSVLYLRRELLRLQLQEAKTSVDSDNFLREMDLKRLEKPPSDESHKLDEEKAHLAAARSTLERDVTSLERDVAQLDPTKPPSAREGRALQERAAMQQKRFAEVVAQGDALYARSKAYLEREEKFVRSTNEIVNRWSFVRKDSRALKAQAEFDEALVSDAKTMLLFSAMGSLYGAWLMITGFRRWKVIQDIQDEALRRSLEVPRAAEASRPKQTEVTDVE